MAHIKNFSYSEALRFGWETTKRHFWFFVSIFLITYVLRWVFTSLARMLFEQETTGGAIAGMLMTLLGWVVAFEISFATIVILLKFIDKKRSDVGELFDFFNFEVLSRFALISFLYGVTVAVGSMLFVVPGIYLGIKYGFASVIYVDKRTGVMEAFRKSAEVTKGVRWKLFIFVLLMALLVLAGALAFVVGLLITVPVAYLAETYVYRKLASHHHTS